MPPPSRPARVTVTSPRDVRSPNDSAMPFSGAPSNRSRKTGDHATVKPQLAGCSGATHTPSASSRPVQRPSEPSCGQDAPPSASTVTSKLRLTGPSGVSKRRAPPGSHPVQRWRGQKATPWPASRRSQARNSGEALKLAGNTRPLVPTSVSSPSARHQRRRASGSKPAIAGDRTSSAAP